MNQGRGLTGAQEFAATLEDLRCLGREIQAWDAPADRDNVYRLRGAELRSTMRRRRVDCILCDRPHERQCLALVIIITIYL